MASQRVCFAVLALAYGAFAQSQQAQFNQVVNLNGDVRICSAGISMSIKLMFI